MVKTQLHYVDSSSIDSFDDPVSSSLVSRNITVMGRRTSVRLEPEMWVALRDIAKREKCTIHDICTLVSLRKSALTSLTAAIRVFLMLYYKAAATEEGHTKASHGNFEEMKRRAKIPEELSSYFRLQKRSARGAPAKVLV